MRLFRYKLKGSVNKLRLKGVFSQFDSQISIKGEKLQAAVFTLVFLLMKCLLTFTVV